MSKESQPILNSESFLEKTKKFALQVLGIAVLAGLSYIGIKEFGGILKGKITELEKFVKL